MTADVLTAAELLALEPAGPDRLRSVRNQDNRAGIILGGQPLAQALAAAQTTVADWPAHSLSGLFLRGGQVDAPVDYQVERVRDGRRYAGRRVLASQDGRPIFDMVCSFHAPEEDVGHQMGDIAGVPAPETLPTLAEFVAAHADALPGTLRYAAALPFPVQLRLCDPEGALVRRDERNTRDFWFRVPTARDLADPRHHHCLLAFASDYWLAGTASSAHAVGRRGVSIASLNHSLWLHGPVDAGDWLLHRTDSPWAGRGRGLARGLIYDRGGRLVATSAQEIQLRTVSAP